MEKNIAYPTDSGLLEKLRKKIVAFMNKPEKLTIRQSYSRTWPRLAQQVGRYAHAKQFKRKQKAHEMQSNRVGLLQSGLNRKIEKLVDTTTKAHAGKLVNMSKRLIAQTRKLKKKDKIYAIHELGVDCISKGKARKRYELGAKVGIVCTQEEGFVVAMGSYAGAPYDSHSLNNMHSNFDSCQIVRHYRLLYNRDPSQTAAYFRIAKTSVRQRINHIVNPYTVGIGRQGHRISRIIGMFPGTTGTHIETDIGPYYL